MSDNDLTQIVTFYSYKGGVGRSMAVLNVSALLASRGFRVLVIDFDLEAPGLSHLLAEALLKKEKRKISGLVELLHDAKTRGNQSDLFAKKFSAIASKYTFNYPIPKELEAHKDARLFIMPAGETDLDYSARLDDLNLGGLYKEGLGKPLIQHFKQALVSSGLYDFIFCDSRTGHSDEAGICTRDLADHLMIVSGFNRQNLAGTASFLGNLRAVLEKEGRKPKNPTIILSPVPIGEEEMLSKREKEAFKLFKEAWKSPLKLDLFIPYHPRLALTEDAYVTTRTASYLRDSYQEIEMRLLMALGQLPRTLLDKAKRAIESGAGATAVSFLERYAKLRNSGSRNTPSQRGFPFAWQITLDLADDENLLSKTLLLPESLRIIELLYISASSSYRILQFAKQLHRLNYIHASDFDRLILDEGVFDADELGNYANFLTDISEQHDVAESFYKRAIEADPKHASNLGNYATFLTDVRGQHDAAELFYKRSLQADPQHANNLSNYGVFLTHVRGQHDAALAFYKQSIEAGSKSASILGNYGQFLAGRGNFNQGLEILYSAWRQSKAKAGGNAAELALSLWLSAQLCGKDGLSWERAFKHLILAGFPRHRWNFNAMLKQAESKLSPALLKYAKALAEAFLDETKVAALDRFARWKKLEPLDPKFVEQI